MDDENYRLQRAMQLAMMPEEEIFSIDRRRAYNEVLSDYFERLCSDLADRSVVFQHTIISPDEVERIKYNIVNCNKHWDWDIHYNEKAMQLKRMNNCHSRYCPNCQKLIQGTRLGNFYGPITRTAAQEGVKLYMATFTVPNPPLQDLRFTLDVMREAYAKFIMFLSGREKLRGYDFSSWGYRASVCSFECTYNNRTFTGHPHFHAVLALSDKLDNVKKHVNDFSVKFGSVVDLFSDIEIFLQKLWRLLFDRITVRRILQAEQDAAQRRNISGFMNRIKKLKSRQLDYGQTPFLNIGDIVRKRSSGQIKAERIRLQNIYDLDRGYSVKLEPVDDDNFKQAFKYAFKLIDDDKEFLSYDVFVAFFDQFYRRHTIQGYGDWRGVDCSDRISEISASIFKGLREMLAADQPVRLTMSPDESVQYAREYGLKMLSASAIRAILLDLTPDELLSVSDDFKQFKRENVSLDVMLEKGICDEKKKVIYTNFFTKFKAYKETRRKFNETDERYDRILEHTPKLQSEILELTDEQLKFIDDIF